MPADTAGIPASTWLLALSSGLAGAVLTQGITWLKDYWRRPVLKIYFSKTERGCSVDTPYGAIAGSQRVLRIRVKNDGHTTAHGVTVSMVDISLSPFYGGEALFIDEEVLDFHLAISDKTTFDLPPGLHRFIDIIYVNEPTGQEPETSFGFLQTPVRFYPLQLTGGKCSAGLIATAGNASPTGRRINWQGDGTRQGLIIDDE